MGMLVEVGVGVEVGSEVAVAVRGTGVEVSVDRSGVEVLVDGTGVEVSVGGTCGGEVIDVVPAQPTIRTDTITAVLSIFLSLLMFLLHGVPANNLELREHPLRRAVR